MKATRLWIILPLLACGVLTAADLAPVTAGTPPAASPAPATVKASPAFPLDTYFQRSPAAVEIPIAKLRWIRPETRVKIDRAKMYQRLDEQGVNSPRAPVKVADNGDGTCTVVDGHATVWGLAECGYPSVRAEIVGRNTGSPLINTGLLVKDRAVDPDPDGIVRQHGLEGMTGLSARERIYDLAVENIPALEKIIADTAAELGFRHQRRRPRRLPRGNRPPPEETPAGGRESPEVQRRLRAAHRCHRRHADPAR